MNLIIDNSQCQLVGFTQEQFEELRLLTSYMEEQRSRFSGVKSVRKHLMSVMGVFPTGLLYIVDAYLKKHKIKFNEIDKRIRPKTRKGGDTSLFLPSCTLKPYPEQIEAAKAILNHSGPDAGRGIIVAPTGCGKTLIVGLICDFLQVSTLIATPSLELKRQTIATLRSWFGKDIVGPLGENGDKKYFITVENYDALDTSKDLKFDCVIVDEFHHSGAKSLRDLNKKAWKSAYFRVGMTATPFRSRKNEKLLLESVISKVVYKIDYLVAVQKGYICPINPYYYELPAIKTVGNKKNYAAMYSELVVNRKDRNQLIVDLIISLHEAKKSTLVLVQHIEHGKKLQEMLIAEGYDIAFANGQDDQSRMYILEFNLRERDVLIGSSIIGEGVDTKPCEYVILAGGVGKSRVRLMQNCGRAFRRYEDKQTGKIISFRDRSHKWFAEHHKEFVKTLAEEYNLEACKLGAQV